MAKLIGAVIVLLLTVLALVCAIIGGVWVYSTLNAPTWVWAVWSAGIGSTILISVVSAIGKALSE